MTSDLQQLGESWFRHIYLVSFPQSKHHTRQKTSITQIYNVQVLNQHRDSAGSMTGVGVRSGSLRTTQYRGRSRSKTTGSILLMSKDNPDFSLDNIQDPVGLANMIKVQER